MSEKLNALKTIFIEAAKNVPVGIKAAFKQFTKDFTYVCEWNENNGREVAKKGLGSVLRVFTTGTSSVHILNNFARVAQKTPDGAAFYTHIEQKLSAFEKKYK